jgi:hypothetical protein
MALQTHRFRLATPSVSELAKVIVGGGTLVAGDDPSTPLFVDYKIDDGNASSLIELTAELSARGFAYEALNPGTTPTAQAATLLGVGGTGTKLWVDEDFVTGNVDSDEIGKHGFRATVTGTGSTIAVLPGEVGRTGIIRLDGGTAAAAKAAMHLGETGAGLFNLGTGQNQWDVYWDVRPQNSILATGVQIIQCGFGLEWTATDELLNGAYVRYLPGTDTFWSLVLANGGTRSVVAGTTSPVLNTWVRAGIRITYPGGVPTAQLMINGAAQGATETANFPTGAMGWGVKIDGIAAPVAEGMLDVDRCEVAQAL